MCLISVLLFVYRENLSFSSFLPHYILLSSDHFSQVRHHPILLLFALAFVSCKAWICVCDQIIESSHFYWMSMTHCVSYEGVFTTGCYRINVRLNFLNLQLSCNHFPDCYSYYSAKVFNLTLIFRFISIFLSAITFYIKKKRSFLRLECTVISLIEG